MMSAKGEIHRFGNITLNYLWIQWRIMQGLLKKKEVNILSEWLKSVMSIMHVRFKNLNGSMNTNCHNLCPILFANILSKKYMFKLMNTNSTFNFKDSDISKHIFNPHGMYVVVSIDKTLNNIEFVYKWVILKKCLLLKLQG